MDKDKLIYKILQGKANVSFDDCVALLNALGFRLARRRGSHHIFVHPKIREIINIQNVSGKIKRYQLKQIARIVEKYGLTVADD